MRDTVGPDGVTRSALFYTTPQLGNWQDTAAMRTQTLQPATYAAVIRELPRTADTVIADPSLPAMQRVTARITFTDLFEYNPNTVVNAQAFNNIMHALANDQARVTLNAVLNNNDRQSLERARLLAPSPLTWEEAIDILVRFYELRTRRVITPMTLPDMVRGLNNATPALQQSILKAADIGFVTGAVNPQGAFTMGELMGILDILIADIGF
jgi:hypothetical protein